MILVPRSEEPAIVPLADVYPAAGASVDEVGRKAATLGALSAAGVPEPAVVPPGVVVTTSAVRRLRFGHSTDAARTREQVRAAVGALAVDAGTDRVAVRSSAVEEDALGASYAGQYESVLGVPAPAPTPAAADQEPDPEAPLFDAIGTVRESATSARVDAYRRARGREGGKHDPRMAVLIQPMLSAAAGGVLFTIDPVTGAEERVVEAARGGAQSVVAGTETPAQYRLRPGGGAEPVAGSGRAREQDPTGPPEPVLSEECLTALAELADRIDAWADAPQSVEWLRLRADGEDADQDQDPSAAVGSDGGLAVVQSRPVASR